MFFNKKGEGASYMGSKTTDIILALAGLVVIGIVIVAVFKTDVLADVTCKGSVYFADQSKGLFPAICYTGDKVIEEENKVKVMLEVAESMRKCWSMWGEGNLNAEGKNLWYNDEFKCFKCTRLKFTSMEGTITYEEFVSFLQDSNNKVRGSKDTYWNYFNGNVIFNLPDDYLKKNMIRNNEGYGVTFVEDVKENNWAQYVLKGGVGGAALGTSICIVTPGFVFTPLCALGGAVAGITYEASEELINKINSWLYELPDSDAIMISRYGDAGICSGYID